jgi:hypothetical protein
MLEEGSPVGEVIRCSQYFSDVICIYWTSWLNLTWTYVLRTIFAASVSKALSTIPSFVAFGVPTTGDPRRQLK